MSPQEKQILEAFLSKAFNLDSGAMTSLYNEVGELITVEPLLAVNAERVAKQKEISESQYKRGIKESREKLEKELKSEYGIDSELQGSELVKEILAKETESLKAASTVKDDEIEKHPKFIEKRREFEKQMTIKEKEWQEKFESEKAAINYEFVWEKARNKARMALPESKFILPEDAARREKLLKVYESELKELYKYAPTEDGSDFIVLDKEGNPAQDNQGNMLKFQDVVKSVGSTYFPVQTSEPRSSTGNTGGNAPVTSYKFKDKEDYRSQVQQAGNDMKKIAEMSKAWEGQQQIK